MRKRILIISGILLLLSLLIVGCGSKATGGAVTDTENSVSISLSDITNTAQFYEYDDNSVTIKYFTVLGRDGNPRVAFDACDVCGGYKGYQQQGSDIKCRNCSKVFSIDSLGTKNKGYGCWPSYLPHQLEGDTIYIGISNIKAGRHRFA